MADLSEQVKALSEARAAPSDPHARERRFAENYRDALVKAQSRWFSAEGDDDAAA